VLSGLLAAGGPVRFGSPVGARAAALPSWTISNQACRRHGRQRRRDRVRHLQRPEQLGRNLDDDDPTGPVPGAASPNSVLKMDVSVVSYAGFVHNFENGRSTRG